MPTIKLPELSGKYTSIVSATDGLISEAPACTKALDKLGENATEANLKAAVTALEAQTKDVGKGLAKAGDKAAKTAKTFDTAIDSLVANIKKISKAVTEIQAALR